MYDALGCGRSHPFNQIPVFSFFFLNFCVGICLDHNRGALKLSSITHVLSHICKFIYTWIQKDWGEWNGSILKYWWCFSCVKQWSGLQYLDICSTESWHIILQDFISRLFWCCCCCCLIWKHIIWCPSIVGVHFHLDNTINLYVHNFPLSCREEREREK